jgi:hypothetical protein
MADTRTSVLINSIREAAYSLAGINQDYDPLMELIGELVLY